MLVEGLNMLNPSSMENRYAIILDILAEMVTNYMTKSEEVNLSENKRKDDDNEN